MNNLQNEGRVAFQNNQPFDATWPSAKQQGWNDAFDETLRGPETYEEWSAACDRNFG